MMEQEVEDSPMKDNNGRSVTRMGRDLEGLRNDGKVVRKLMMDTVNDERQMMMGNKLEGEQEEETDEEEGHINRILALGVNCLQMFGLCSTHLIRLQ
jgi:hypothetical protein